MPIHRHAIWAAFVTTFSFPSIAVAQVPAPDPANYANAVHMRDFVGAFMHGQVVASCVAHGYKESERLSTAYAAWQQPLTESISLGKAVLLKTRPEYGATEDALRDYMLKRYRQDTEPAVLSSLNDACDARLSLLETGLPVPLLGKTATDKSLRLDIYNQAALAVSCFNVESIDASVIKQDPLTVSEEKWLVNGCGKPVPITVTYSPNPAGGTNFVVNMKGDALSPEERKQRLEMAKRLVEDAKKRQAPPKLEAAPSNDKP